MAKGENPGHDCENVLKFRTQFWRTSLCPEFHRNRRCSKGHECPFAHDPNQLRARPNLDRTALCRSPNCEKGNCRFAHCRKELRANPEFSKVHMCRYGDECSLGNTCRYAHSVDELRERPSGPASVTAAVAEQPQQPNRTDQSTQTTDHEALHPRSQGSKLPRGGGRVSAVDPVPPTTGPVSRAKGFKDRSSMDPKAVAPQQSWSPRFPPLVERSLPPMYVTPPLASMEWFPSQSHHGTAASSSTVYAFVLPEPAPSSPPPSLSFSPSAYHQFPDWFW